MQFRELTDRYQLEKILKSNRFGTVLRATDSKSGRTVVAKLITVPSPPRLVAAAPEFEKLAATLAGLAHPSLPAVLDSGFTTDGSAFLVLELLEGKGLDAAGGGAPGRTLARIGQALDGLDALGARGFAHLNLSPDNLFVVPAPAGEQVKLLGLGTAVFRPRGPEAAAAGAGEGSRFQAPELAAGAPADGSADIYSLALTACQALGATVGYGDTPVVQLPLAVSFELENDEALRQALERSLRKNPAERPSSRELREALRLAAAAPTVAAPAAAPVVPFPISVQASPSPPLAVQSLPAIPSPAVPGPAIAAQAPALLEIPDAWAPASPALPAAAPRFTEPDPLAPPEGSPEESSGELLSSVDDEVLNALLSVPPPGPRAPSPPPQKGKGSGKVVPFLKKGPPPATAGTSAPQAPRAPEPALKALLRRPAALGAIAGLVALVAVAGFWLLRRHPGEAVVQAPAAGVALPPPPSRPPVEKLEEARLALAQGDDLKARRVLRSIPWGEQGLLPADGCRVLGSIQENLALAALGRLPADLASGLRSGDLEVLETAVEAGAGQEAALAPDVRAAYDRARGVVDAYAQARAASAQGNPVQALERFATVAALLPKMSDPEDLRGKAAAALEAQADALAREGRYEEGLARLAPVLRSWPDRAGLKERAARFQTYQENEKRQEGILAELPTYERHRKPWDGLQVINGVEPTPHLAQRFQEARARLEDLLSRLDREPPKVTLRDGYLLEYSRGTVAELSFRATDDYQVKDVKLMARAEGGKYHDLPLDKNRSGYYTVQIQPAFHQNGNVDFYVVATDLSGHEASLGSRDQPMQLKRRQGFERLIR
ncbi:MAG TPA: hypothetical protein VGH73_23630 [Thermoanaerobaculia bacterium]